MEAKPACHTLQSVTSSSNRKPCLPLYKDGGSARESNPPHQSKDYCQRSWSSIPFWCLMLLYAESYLEILLGRNINTGSTIQYQPVSGIWSAKCRQKWTGWSGAAPLYWYVVAQTISNFILLLPIDNLHYKCPGDGYYPPEDTYTCSE